MSTRATRERSPRATSSKGRLSYNEQRELAGLPEEIEALESEQTQLSARMSAPEYHRPGAEALRGDRKRLEELESLLQQKFTRWEWLEEKRTRSG